MRRKYSIKRILEENEDFYKEKFLMNKPSDISLARENAKRFLLYLGIIKELKHLSDFSIEQTLCRIYISTENRSYSFLKSDLSEKMIKQLWQQQNT